MTGALHHHGGLRIPIGRADRPEQGQGHQPQDLPLSQGQGGEAGGRGASGGDNGVVVRDFPTVADLGGQHLPRRVQATDYSGGGDQSGEFIWLKNH